MKVNKALFEFFQKTTKKTLEDISKEYSLSPQVFAILDDYSTWDRGPLTHENLIAAVLNPVCIPEDFSFGVYKKTYASLSILEILYHNAFLLYNLNLDSIIKLLVQVKPIIQLLRIYCRSLAFFMLKLKIRLDPHLEKLNDPNRSYSLSPDNMNFEKNANFISKDLKSFEKRLKDFFEQQLINVTNACDNE